MVLETVTAARRRPRRRRRVARAPSPVAAPTVRATVVDARGFASEDEAAGWLAGLRADRDALAAAVEEGVDQLNTLVRAHRVAAADPYVGEVTTRAALAVRVGHGPGEAVARGEIGDAIEVPREPTVRRGDLLAPAERLARIVGGREPLSPGEELLLRARADLRAQRRREAALQARIALEALLAELEGEGGRGAAERAELTETREAVAAAARAALDGEVPVEAREGLSDALDRMGAAVRRRSLSGG